MFQQVPPSSRKIHQVSESSTQFRNSCELQQVSVFPTSVNGCSRMVTIVHHCSPFPRFPVFLIIIIFPTISTKFHCNSLLFTRLAATRTPYAFICTPWQFHQFHIHLPFSWFLQLTRVVPIVWRSFISSTILTFPTISTEFHHNSLLFTITCGHSYLYALIVCLDIFTVFTTIMIFTSY